jgi:hypothetical protein
MVLKSEVSNSNAAGRDLLKKITTYSYYTFAPKRDAHEEVLNYN